MPADPNSLEETKKQDVDSTVKILSEIGMSGITIAASAVEQLSGQESGSQSKLLILTIDQMRDEILGIGNAIALIEAELHSNAGEVNGNMQMYLLKDTAIKIADELLCTPQDMASREFTEDIVSTLKEAVNIFGGQYVSAISEFIGVPILLSAPNFKTGSALQVSESVMKNIAGKVEFALATTIAFGSGKTGLLIILLDPKSMNMIMTKLS